MKMLVGACWHPLSRNEYLDGVIFLLHILVQFGELIDFAAKGKFSNKDE